MARRVPYPVLAVLLAGLCSCSSDEGDDGPLGLAIELTRGVGRVGSRSMIYDGEHFAAVWVRTPGVSEDFKLMFARVSEDQKLIAGPVEVLDLGKAAASFRFFAAGSGYILLWREHSNTSPIKGLHIDRSGRAVSSVKEVETITSPYTNSSFGAAWNGSQLGLVTQKKVTVDINGTPTAVFRLYFALFTDDFVSISKLAPISTATDNQYSPSLTWIAKYKGTGAFLALWEQSKRIHGATLSAADGAVIDAPAKVFETSAAQVGAGAHSTGDGRALITWHHDYVSSPLLLLAGPLQPVWQQPNTPVPDNRADSIDFSLALQGGQATVAWQNDAQEALGQINVGRLDVSQATADLTDVTSVSDPAFYFSSPSVVAGKNKVGVLFSGTVRGSSRLYFRVLDTD